MISSGTHVSTSIGFCLTLLPLLYTDFGSIFGNREEYFIRTVPTSELSTPEEYLKSMDQTPPTRPTDGGRSDDETGIESDVVEIVTDDAENPETAFVNEETPLLT